MTLIVSSILILAVIGLLVGLMLVFVSETFHVEVDEREAAVRECLPGNNCGGCGYAGCDAVAAAIVKGEAPVNACPVGGAPVADKISEIMGISADSTEKMVAFVKCAGTCDVMKVKCNYFGIESCEAAGSLPGKGVRACQQGCLGYGSCVKACPQNLIELVPDRSTYAVQCSSTEKGKTVKALCDVGCLGCGLCVRQCEQGAITLKDNVAHIDYDKCIGCGKCAEKCPAKIIRLR
ncbi:MAG: RnfABCDGE type electron transport complex subunit B [Clostridiales bacterium]|nr:RnfABCDGE type electron transport complex subunit B [Clostridiales bacterium]